MAAHACNSSTGKRTSNLRPAWVINTRGTYVAQQASTVSNKQHPQGSAPPLAAAVSSASNEATFSVSSYLSHLLPRRLCLSAYETPYPRMQMEALSFSPRCSTAYVLAVEMSLSVCLMEQWQPEILSTKIKPTHMGRRRQLGAFSSEFHFLPLQLCISHRKNQPRG